MVRYAPIVIKRLGEDIPAFILVEVPEAGQDLTQVFTRIRKQFFQSGLRIGIPQGATLEKRVPIADFVGTVDNVVRATLEKRWGHPHQ